MVRLALVLLLWLAPALRATPALPYTEISVERGGTVRGKVVLRGGVPRLGLLPVFKNREVCGDFVPDGSLEIGPTRGVRNVAVVLEGVTAGKPRASSPAMLDNLRCAFVPRVQTVTVGQVLEIRNSDPILHDAHARLESGQTLFNLGLPVWRRVRRVLRHPGVLVVDCNVLHTWMRAYIIVTEHPYATVTDGRGSFTLERVPPGRYTLRLWHERLGPLAGAVAVEAGSEAWVSLSYGPP